MVIDWPVTISPRWRRARPLLLAPTLPYFALRHLARRIAGGPLPPWMQAVLFVPAFLFLGVPTRVYEGLGILTMPEDL